MSILIRFIISIRMNLRVVLVREEWLDVMFNQIGFGLCSFLTHIIISTHFSRVFCVWILAKCFLILWGCPEYCRYNKVDHAIRKGHPYESWPGWVVSRNTLPASPNCFFFFFFSVSILCSCALIIFFFTFEKSLKLCARASKWICNETKIYSCHRLAKCLSHSIESNIPFIECMQNDNKNSSSELSLQFVDQMNVLSLLLFAQQ